MVKLSKYLGMARNSQPYKFLRKTFEINRVHADFLFKGGSLTLLEKGIAPRENSDVDSTARGEILMRICKAYAHMKSAQKSAPWSYQPGHKWGPEIEETRKRTIAALRSEDVSQLGQVFGSFLRSNEMRNLLKHATYESLIQDDRINTFRRKKFVLNILADLEIWKAQFDKVPLQALAVPDVGNPFGCEIDGVLVTAATCSHNYYARQIDSCLQTDSPSLVAEIGGGFGGLAYHLLKSGKLYTYIDFDLPEIIVLAQYYLMCAFPEKKFLLYGENDSQEIDREIINAYDVILMPNFELPRLMSNSVDVFVNTHSLSEMDYETVAEYIQQITRTCKKFFYHENSEKEHNIGYGKLEVPASSYPISDQEFELVFRKKAIWREPRYWEYLYKKIDASKQS